MIFKDMRMRTEEKTNHNCHCLFIPIKVLTLILKALLNPLAKNPPNGAINELKDASTMPCQIMGYIQISVMLFIK